MNKTYQKTKIDKASQMISQEKSCSFVPTHKQNIPKEGQVQETHIPTKTTYTQMPKTLEAHLYVKDT
jgi:hypothetical protein